ncbi:unnamed protein product, partial [Pylaiella littoralis]
GPRRSTVGFALLLSLLSTTKSNTHACHQTTWAAMEAVTMIHHRRQSFSTGAGSSGSRLRRPLSWVYAAVTAAAAVAMFLILGPTCSAVEGFSSFTFGSVPGGEPRFSFNGFNPGGMGGGGGGGGAAVDNEGYYKILEVGKTVDASSITKAYRRLARRKHPDKGGDPEEFKALAEAYEVLSDPEKRRRYDQVGKAGLQAGGGGGGAGMDQSRQQADMFRSFFGRFSQPQPVRMRDVVYEMEVSLEELCHGGAKKVRIWSEVPAEGGRGQRERVARDIEIGLSAGMATGTRIVIEGGVDPIEEGIEAGDLVFVLQETRHRTFRRLTADSPHLTADVTVTLAEALTGLVRPITLVDGRTVYFKTKEGEVISPGAVRKLPGFGMPVGERGTGDLYLRFVVKFPDEEAVAAWGEAERKTLENLLPPKPEFPKEKPDNPAVEAQSPEPNVASRFKAGLYDKTPRGPSRAAPGAWGSGGVGGGNPFGFFGL